jgi:hypothetical protein
MNVLFSWSDLAESEMQAIFNTAFEVMKSSYKLSNNVLVKVTYKNCTKG